MTGTLGCTPFSYVEGTLLGIWVFFFPQNVHPGWYGLSQVSRASPELKPRPVHLRHGIEDENSGAETDQALVPVKLRGYRLTARTNNEGKLTESCRQRYVKN